jgi:anti-anti-sigma factor
MELHYTELDNDIRLIKLNGKLDNFSVNEIDIKFAGHCAGEKVRMIVDLSGVEFLASIGIRLLTSNAKSLSTRGGKLVLLSPIPDVYNVLEMTGIIPVIPVFSDLETASAALKA